MKIIEYVGGVKKYSFEIGMGITLEIIVEGKMSRVVFNNQ